MIEIFKRLTQATTYGVNGCIHAYRHEWAFRFECHLLMIALILVGFIAQTMWHACLLLASLWLVMVCELLNSAIESCIDRISLEKHALSQQAKDMAAGAVLLLCLASSGLWLHALGLWWLKGGMYAVG